MRIIGNTHFVIDEEPEFMPLEEQLERFAQTITKQGLFEFLLRPSLREGEVSQEVIPISVANTVLDPETGEQQFPDQAGVAKFCSLLTVHSGVPIKRLLAEQDVLYPTPTQELPRPKPTGRPTASQQPSTEKSPTATSDVATAHPPLPPRRHRISNRRG
jgi:hypothetical protein